MLIHIKQLVTSLLILVSVLTSVSAKEIPITQEVELIVPVGDFSVVEFPFKISSRHITSFMSSKEMLKNKDEDSVNTSKQGNEDLLNSKEEVTKEKVTPKGVGSKNKENITVIQNINSFTFFPKKAGYIKLVVWGYEHPILLTIKAEIKNGFGLYQLILPQSKSDLVAKTEQGSHEETINMVMVHLFNQTLPKGYKNSSKDAIFMSNGFEIRLNREVIGKKYIGQEWVLTNKSDEDSNIHEESFYEKGVYGVSIEADSVETSKSIRVFIVRAGAEEIVK